MHVPPPLTVDAPLTVNATDPVGRAGEPPVTAATVAVQVVDAPGATVPGAHSTVMPTGGPFVTVSGFDPVDARCVGSPL